MNDLRIPFTLWLTGDPPAAVTPMMAPVAIPVRLVVSNKREGDRRNG